MSTSLRCSDTDTGLAPGTAYTYTVTASDPAQNTSSLSAALQQATQNCPAPPAPTGLTATAQSGTKVLLGWSPVAPAAGCSITNYLVQRGGTTIAAPASTSYTDTSVKPNRKYTYTVQAVATGGIRGARSRAVTVTTP